MKNARSFAGFVVDDIGGDLVPTLHEILNPPGRLPTTAPRIKAELTNFPDSFRVSAGIKQHP